MGTRSTEPCSRSQKKGNLLLTAEPGSAKTSLLQASVSLLPQWEQWPWSCPLHRVQQLGEAREGQGRLAERLGTSGPAHPLDIGTGRMWMPKLSFVGTALTEVAVFSGVKGSR